jgi:hypothetical protein
MNLEAQQVGQPMQQAQIRVVLWKVNNNLTANSAMFSEIYRRTTQQAVAKPRNKLHLLLTI